jgi:hypothetical protein
MLVAIALAAALATASVPLSPAARSAIAPVLDAIAAERTAQAKLPAPKDDAEKLVRLGRLDQAGRIAIGRVDFSKAPEAERALARKAMGDTIDQVDAANQSELLKMLPPEGWFTFSQYGREAATAAFHIVQHSDVAQWRRFVPVLERLVAQGEAEGQSYALMYDRLAVNEGRPQRYGSQLRCVGGHWQAYPLEDPSNVDERRRSMGLTMPFAEYVKLPEAQKLR